MEKIGCEAEGGIDAGGLFSGGKSSVCAGCKPDYRADEPVQRGIYGYCAVDTYVYR